MSIDPLLEHFVEIIRNLTQLTDDVTSSDNNNPETSKKMKDRIHELIDLLAKAQNTLPDSSLSKVEIPLGLVKHIDAGNSPNVWLMDLLKLLTEQQDKARGEFSAIRTLHEALCKRLVHKHVLTVNDIDIINENDFENGGT